MPLYSYSRIGCFETCPRQYKFRYKEKPDIDRPVGVEAFMGSMAHKALEHCYRLAQAGRVMSAEELQAYFLRIWEDELPGNLKIVREELTADDYRTMGSKALARYHATYAPFDQELTIGLERQVIFALDPEERYKMQGYIDRLSRDASGCLRIQDYKTSGTLPTQQDADRDAQLALYQIAVDKMWPDNNGIELVWHYLQFDTTLVSRRTSDQLDELKEIYIRKIKQIERAEELGNFPTQESALCNWCDYYEICPAKGGRGAEVANGQESIDLLTEMEIQQLVDEYIVLDTARKNADKRQRDIRDMLIPFGEVGSSKMLAGTGKAGITIALSKIAKLPTKSSDPDTVEKISQLVAEAGLAEEFMILDTAALQKAFTEGRLPPGLMERLRLYEQIIIQDRIRITKS